ncbi:MAG: YigZ family protein [Mariprofundaceae bacterium]
MSDYFIPANAISVEQEIKRSRFITSIAHTESKTDAVDFIKETSEKYADARHNCWAYIAGHPVESIKRGFSDAGEPSGTAGKPMLNVLQYKNIGEISVVVSRYFGGIKLGAGGLVRAYSSSVQQGMDGLVLKERIAMVPMIISFPFSIESQVRHILSDYQVEIINIDYTNDATMALEAPLKIKTIIANDLINRTHGKVEIISEKNQPNSDNN